MVKDKNINSTTSNFSKVKESRLPFFYLIYLIFFLIECYTYHIENKIEKNTRRGISSFLNGNVKSAMYKYINNKIAKDIEDLIDLPEDSEFYYTINGDKFLIYKKQHMIILMSPLQA